MRQGQQNRRGRGRNNNNNNQQHRKGQHHHNPLMRTYQSNGPDQKIHGTPAQIAEKYMALARDALSSGDPVLAENYLQHAEHYQRIINTWNEEFRDFSRPAAAPQAVDGNTNVADDLALPISILGGDLKAKNEEDVREAAYEQAAMLETA